MGKGRRPCCDKEGVKKGPWSEAEDLKLISFIQKHGHSNWRALPKLAGLARCGKSCRLRWVNYLRPDLKRGHFTIQEEEAIIKLHAALGNKWSKIASHFPGRTDNEIKNVWNTHLKKRVKAKTSSLTSEFEEISNNDCQQQEEVLQATNQITSPIEEMTTIDTEHSSSSSTSYNSQASFFISNFHTTDDRDLNTDNMTDHNNTTKASVDKINKDLPTPEELIEIPFEPSLDLWDLLDGDSNISSANSNELVTSEIDKKNNFEEDGGSWPWWLIYMENELGFDSF